MPSEVAYQQNPNLRSFAVTEQGIEDAFIAKLRDLKYSDRPDIHDCASLEANTNAAALVRRLLSEITPYETTRATIPKVSRRPQHLRSQRLLILTPFM